eukprot:TRINITY_DN23231_c0_g1_i1.p1 TRINITY_DN23231_c0_g1~~TRINITY_DN23231_c0_g1_i1.p1  ORF type:complete len:669 (+),score=166.19 TRINITY_DN23231_c0_g1_i1:93-2099(+)
MRAGPAAAGAVLLVGAAFVFRGGDPNQRRPAAPLPRGQPAEPDPALPPPARAKRASKPAAAVAPSEPRWWWDWFVDPAREREGPLRVVVIGGRLRAADAAAWQHHFAPTEVRLYADKADPAAKATVSWGCGRSEHAVEAAEQLGGATADLVVDLGMHSDPTQQVAAWRRCFPRLLRPGGVWVSERVGRVYADPSAAFDLRRSIVAIGRAAIDQINRRYWDPLRSVVLYPGLDAVETVLFAEGIVAFTRKGLWGPSWDTVPYPLGTLNLLPPGAAKLTRDADSITGQFGEPPSWSYFAGGDTSTGGKYANPPCAASEPGFGAAPPKGCAAAAEEAKAPALQEDPPAPRIGAPHRLPTMDSLGSGTEKVGGSSRECVVPHGGISKALAYNPCGHGYDRWYQWYMDPLRDRKTRLFEIGIDSGASTAMWRKYFPKLELHGMDYSKTMAADRNRSLSHQKDIKVFSGDQANVEQLRAMVRSFGERSMDVIVDDGGHVPTQQLNSFKVLFRDLLRPGGIYTIEDLEGSYWGRHGMYSCSLYGGLGKRGTMIELMKLFIDTINRAAWDATGSRCVLETGADAQVESVLFAPNVAIFTKKGRRSGAPRPGPASSSPPPPPKPETPPVPQSGRTWDGVWRLPRPQCEATTSSPGPDYPSITTDPLWKIVKKVRVKR